MKVEDDSFDQRLDDQLGRSKQRRDRRWRSLASRFRRLDHPPPKPAPEKAEFISPFGATP
jgi:hypothetical protein